MTLELHKMVKCLHDPTIVETDVITWSSPVPVFGSVAKAKIATLGLNPSNREFVDNKGEKLSGLNRRFHTLSSLGLDCWSRVEHKHLTLIEDDCQNYFNKNPYDLWFKKLDHLISGTSFSYYFPSGQACHLDLIPFATSRKWGELSSDQKETLLEFSAESFAQTLNNSNIQMLILNGKSVINTLQKLTNELFEEIYQPTWNLQRKGSDGVKGYAYIGKIKSVAGIKLKKEIIVIGFNHNIQSSFGVTSAVQKSIRKWITNLSKELLDETI